MTPSEKHLIDQLEELFYQKAEDRSEKESEYDEKILQLLRDNLKPKSDYLEEPKINIETIGI